MWSSVRATQPEPISPHLLRAYRLTLYRVGDHEVRIGRRVPDGLFDELGAREAALVTAWNPLSKRMPLGWNRRMQRRLREHLRRTLIMCADGALRRWHEAHILVAGNPRRTERIARRFRQRGIVIVRPGQRARLVLLRLIR